jgi:hypothetical protein
MQTPALVLLADWLLVRKCALKLLALRSEHIVDPDAQRAIASAVIKAGLSPFPIVPQDKRPPWGMQRTAATLACMLRSVHALSTYTCVLLVVCTRPQASPS